LIGTQERSPINYAQSTFETYRQYFHAWGFRAEDVEAFCQTVRGKSPKFWLDNRPKKWGEGTLRIALEKELAEMKRDRQASLKSESMSESEKRSLARRF
jgi:hypothetical protein